MTSGNAASRAVVAILVAIAGFSFTTATRVSPLRAGTHVLEGSEGLIPARSWKPKETGFLLPSAGRVRFNESQGMFNSMQPCFEGIKAGAHLIDEDEDASCPSSCPYYVEDEGTLCKFSCVSGQMCGSANPKTPYPHSHLNICTKLVMHGCSEQAEWKMGEEMRCSKCHDYYILGNDDQCHFNWMQWFMWPLYAAALVTLGLLVVVVLWVVDLACRPIVNATGLRQGLEHRSRVKVRKHKEVGSNTRNMYPLNENLLKTNVAGAGMLLHFNFQFAVIIWAFVLASVWCVMALVVDTDLFDLGTKDLGTPRRNCILVAWGHDKQHSLMWLKLAYLAFAYVFSFFGCLWLSMRQLRTHQLCDRNEKTMNDFAMLIDNLPITTGADLEDQIKICVQEGTGLQVVGLSVCWDFQDNEEVVAEMIGQQLDVLKEEGYSAQMQETMASSRQSSPVAALEGLDEDDRRRAVRGRFLWVEEKFLGRAPGSKVDTPRGQEAEMLLNMKSSGAAFVVFHTEVDRDNAVELLAKTPMSFRGNVLTATKPDAEPDGVLWNNYSENTGRAPIRTWLIKGTKGMSFWLLGLFSWAGIFYSPYLWAMASWDYSDGAEPGMAYGIAFTVVVVIGNSIMYNVCGMVSDMVGFHVKWKREACYMITYTVACVLNVLLDLICTYYMVWERAKGLQMRTYDGRRLDEVPYGRERFETYPMQRLLGENMFNYAVPATFLVCFVFEPIGTILLPLKLSMWLVRSHPSVQGREAENMLMAPEMDMGRYADIILNVVLAIFVFFFPAGYTHDIFFWLAFSHIYIYCFDQCRTLRTVPSFNLRSKNVDQCAMYMLIPCCGLILSAFVFKAKFTGCLGPMCFEGVNAALAAFVAHCTVHFCMLAYVVPKYAIEASSSRDDTRTYANISAERPCSWFSANPVHCLRSKYVHKHDPPCIYFTRGKEHLMSVNEKIGCHFRSSAAVDEDISHYNAGGLAESLSQDITETSRKLLRRLSSKYFAKSAGENDKATDGKDNST